MEHNTQPQTVLGIWLDDDPLDLVRQHLAEPECAWSVGTWGAIGEFSFEPDEAGLAIDKDRMEIRTRRGALRVGEVGGMRALAISGGDEHELLREIALCLPLEQARRAGRDRVAELGRDVEAIVPQGTRELLFDLGIGAPHIDMYVRVADDNDALVAAMRQAVSKRFVEDGRAAGAVLAGSPPRIFVSAVARLEVCAPIPPPGGRSPDGPHSHLLPHLLDEGRTQGPGSPIPSGWVCGLSLYPGQRRAGRELEAASAHN